MASWDKTLLQAADKIAKGIEKGAERISNSAPVNAETTPNTSNNDVEKDKHCPSCGHKVSSIDLFCPACGLSLEDTTASSAAQTLADKLAVIDNQKEGIIRNFIRVKQEKISEKATQKAQIIKAFPVPNTKKDLLEFIHLAASNINTKILLGQTTDSSLDEDAIKSEKLLSETWLEKMESIYQKAQTLLAGDADFLKIENIYSAKKHEIDALREELRRKSRRSNIGMAILMGMLVLIMIVITSVGYLQERQEKITKNDQLETLVVEIRQDMAEGNYSEALLKTNKIRLKDGSSSDEEKKWDRQREDLIKEIEAAQADESH